MLPTFLGIGATRAGSTWLARNLDEHPDIYIPWAKELVFFDIDENYAKGIDYYQSLFPKWKGEPVVGEVSPGYLSSVAATTRIKQHLPAAKLICSLRNPLERTYSHFWLVKAKFPIPQEVTFEEMLQSNPDLIDFSLYYQHLERYLRSFPREQLHLYLFDDVETAPQKVIKEVFQFLEVDDTFVPSYLHNKVNAATTMSKFARSKLLWYVTRVLRRLSSRTASVQKVIESYNAQPIPPMKTETAHNLKALLKKDVQQLQDLLRIDLSMWDMS